MLGKLWRAISRPDSANFSIISSNSSSNRWSKSQPIVTLSTSSSKNRHNNFSFSEKDNPSIGEPVETNFENLLDSIQKWDIHSGTTQDIQHLTHVVDIVVQLLIRFHNIPLSEFSGLPKSTPDNQDSLDTLIEQDIQFFFHSNFFGHLIELIVLDLPPDFLQSIGLALLRIIRYLDTLLLASCAILKPLITLLQVPPENLYIDKMIIVRIVDALALKIRESPQFMILFCSVDTENDYEGQQGIESLNPGTVHDMIKHKWIREKCHGESIDPDDFPQIQQDQLVHSIPKMKSIQMEEKEETPQHGDAYYEPGFDQHIPMDQESRRESNAPNWFDDHHNDVKVKYVITEYFLFLFLDRLYRLPRIDLRLKQCIRCAVINCLVFHENVNLTAYLTQKYDFLLYVTRDELFLSYQALVSQALLDTNASSKLVYEYCNTLKFSVQFYNVVQQQWPLISLGDNHGLSRYAHHRGYDHLKSILSENKSLPYHESTQAFLSSFAHSVLDHFIQPVLISGILSNDLNSANFHTVLLRETLIQLQISELYGLIVRTLVGLDPNCSPNGTHSMLSGHSVQETLLKRIDYITLKRHLSPSTSSHQEMLMIQLATNTLRLYSSLLQITPHTPYVIHHLVFKNLPLIANPAAYYDYNRYEKDPSGSQEKRVKPARGALHEPFCGQPSLNSKADLSTVEGATKKTITSLNMRDSQMLSQEMTLQHDQVYLKISGDHPTIENLDLHNLMDHVQKAKMSTSHFGPPPVNLGQHLESLLFMAPLYQFTNRKTRNLEMLIYHDHIKRKLIMNRAQEIANTSMELYYLSKNIFTTALENPTNPSFYPQESNIGDSPPFPLPPCYSVSPSYDETSNFSWMKHVIHLAFDKQLEFVMAPDYSPNQPLLQRPFITIILHHLQHLLQCPLDFILYLSDIVASIMQYPHLTVHAWGYHVSPIENPTLEKIQDAALLAQLDPHLEIKGPTNEGGHLSTSSTLKEDSLQKKNDCSNPDKVQSLFSIIQSLCIQAQSLLAQNPELLGQVLTLKRRHRQDLNLSHYETLDTLPFSSSQPSSTLLPHQSHRILILDEICKEFISSLLVVDQLIL